MRTDMTYAIGNQCFCLKARGASAGPSRPLALGGCQSPMYSGTPDDMSATRWRPASRSLLRRPQRSRPTRTKPADQAWTAEQKYEYRGGRDPVTGRANTQM